MFYGGFDALFGGPRYLYRKKYQMANARELLLV